MKEENLFFIFKFLKYFLFMILTKKLALRKVVRLDGTIRVLFVNIGHIFEGSIYLG